MVLPYVLAAATIGGKLFGGGKRGSGEGNPTAPGGEVTKSGWEALPDQVKSAYLSQYLPAVEAQFKQGGTQLAPLNQYQQQAYQSFGGGLGSLQNELPGYTNLYNQEVYNPYYRDLYNENVLNPQLEDINKQYGIARSNLIGGMFKGGNLGNPYSSVFGGQLAGLQEARENMQRQARQQAFQNAIQMGHQAFQTGYGLRGQTLGDILGAGSGLQEYEQQRLYQPQQRLQEFAANLGAFPGGSTSLRYGTNPFKPNTWDRIGGLGQAGLSIGNAFGAF